MDGFAGKILRVNLTNRTIKEDVFSPEDARKYLGGRGVGAKILLEELAPGIDPLGPDNKLIFTWGPATGTPLPGQTRFMVVTKSPLTGYYGEANCSGSFGTEMKQAGYDTLVVEGKADKPVYLWVHNGQAEIRDARHLWGKVTGETEDILKQEMGSSEAWVVGIGPAGEKLVKIAAIISDKHRAAGRCGVGAVMGSKNLKAVIARGTQTILLADRNKLTSIIRTMAEEARNNAGQQNMANYGTSGFIPTLQTQGILPTKNFQEGEFTGASTLSGQHLEATINICHIRCQGCYLPHDRCVEVKNSPYGSVDPAYGGDEYETAAAFGSLCLIDDLVPVNRANQLCNMYGVDTISAGVVIAWVMECYEKGLLTRQDLDGIEAKWGDTHAMLALLEKLCKREGIGDILAEGVKAAAAKIGKGSDQYAMHVKGLEIAMHEPRGKKGLALIYTAAGARGASHMEAAHDTAFEADNALPELGITKGVSRFSIENKGEIICKASDVRTLINDLDICCFIFEPAFGRGTMARLGELVNALSGWDVTTEELMATGARANSLARAFNVREGVSRKDDYLPARFSEPLPSGGSKGQAISRAEMDRMLDDFYATAGWSKDGVPTPQTLSSLGIGWVAEKLAGLPQTPRPA